MIPAAMAAFVVSMLSLLVCSWNHPLFPPDEGRYTQASVAMASGGGWLVPMRDGKPHLTKPPLAYWAQAICIRVLGKSELAARLPSMIAASATVALTLLAGWRFAGRRTGLLAAALLTAMPLQITIGFLATTDALLSLFWFGALVCGLTAIENGRAAWAWVMWACVALGLLVKGPLAFAPIGVLLIWLALSSRTALARRLRFWPGVPISVAPLAVWAALVWRSHPETKEIWYDQIVGRAIGTGDHNEPVWYYLPVFLAGLFPATTLMVLPWLNAPAAACGRFLRSGSTAALFALAVIVPLLMFSLVVGKLPSYLLPLCAPMALCGAIAIGGWLDGRHDRATTGFRPPETVLTLLFCAIGIAIAGFAALFIMSRERTWMAAPLLLPVIGAAWLLRRWKSGPRARAAPLGAWWLATMLGWMWLFQTINHLRAPSSARALVSEFRAAAGGRPPRVLVYGFRDETIEFYAGSPATTLGEPKDLIEAADQEPERTFVLVDASDRDWKAFQEHFGQALSRYGPAETRTLWRNRLVHVLRPLASSAPSG